jgi:hypothetical protein
MTAYLLIATLFAGSEYEHIEVVNPWPYESLPACELAARMMSYSAIVASYRCVTRLPRSHLLQDNLSQDQHP